MKIKDKIVGTKAIQPPTIDHFYGKITKCDGYHRLDSAGFLMKEPTNKFDKYAVAIYGYILTNDERGTAPILIGYLGKTSEAYQLVNSHPKESYSAKITIKQYDNPQYLSSYSVIFEFNK